MTKWETCTNVVNSSNVNKTEAIDVLNTCHNEILSQTTQGVSSRWVAIIFFFGCLLGLVVGIADP
jgi:hypothetical protein